MHVERGGARHVDPKKSVIIKHLLPPDCAPQDENEAVVAQLVYDGLASFDFGHTAYATNTYLK